MVDALDDCRADAVGSLKFVLDSDNFVSDARDPRRIAHQDTVPLRVQTTEAVGVNSQSWLRGDYGSSHDGNLLLSYLSNTIASRSASAESLKSSRNTS